MKIAFIHPDLGIGGAERLVLDAALGLKNLGHEVVIYTSYCNRNHCFEEIQNGDINVIIAGNSIFPRSIFGKFTILFASLRQIHLVLSLQYKNKNYYDAFIVDQLSICIPFLYFRSYSARILFYCHFPDQLLTTRTNFFKKLYRIPFDWIEQLTTSLADSIVVNSKFTKSVFKNQFKLIKVEPNIIYPCVPFDSYTDSKVNKHPKHDPSLHVNKFNSENQTHEEKLIQFLKNLPRFIISINRFERKKNIELAVRSFAKAKNLIAYTNPQNKLLESSSSNEPNLLLIIAGGYDKKNKENKEYFNELLTLCKSLNLKSQTLEKNSLLPKDFFEVLFMPSISNTTKQILLHSAQLLLYTPDREHFGIVPIESLAAGTPVLAANSGGPLETIQEGITGWHRDINNYQAWAEIIAQVCDPTLPDSVSAITYQKMSQNGKKFSQTEFSREAMSKKFENELKRIIESDPRRIHFLRSKLFISKSCVCSFIFLFLAICLSFYF